MKKLMIALAVIAMAAAVKAATVTWTATNIFQPATSVKATGYIGYFFEDTGSKDVDAIVAAIKDKTFDTTYGTSAMASKTSNNGAITVSGLGSYDSGTYNFYTVLFDASTSDAAKNYIVTDNVAVSYTSAMGGKAAAFVNITGATSGSNWQSVPEPTSAMLLLLGVAGLALKRKQK